MSPQQIENLRTENAELQAILAQIGDAVVGINFESTITYFNPAAEQRYGVPAAEAVGQKITDVFKYLWVQPEDEQLSKAALAEKGEWHGQNIHITRDGRELVVDSRVRVMRDARNQPVGLLAVIRDITVAKSNEAKLREHDQRLRMHIANSPLAVVEMDRNFHIIGWSGQAEKMFGWSRSEALGLDLWQMGLIYDEDLPLIMENCAKLITGEVPNLTLANRNLTKDRRVIDCLWYNSVVFDQAGKMQSIVSLGQDITAQKKAEQALKASEEIHRLVAEFSQTGFWDWDLLKGDVQFSRIYKKQLGYEDHEIASGFEEFRNLCHPEDFQRVLGQLHASQADPTVPFNTELRMRHKDGTWRWIWCQAVVIRDANLKPVRMIGTHIDLTERKKNEEEIRQLNTELEDRVARRTKELRAAVQTLEMEIAARRRLEQELLETSEREQRRLGQDLHDDLGQQLAAIGILVQILEAKLTKQQHPNAPDLSELTFFCRNALEATRNLARSFYPVELQRAGLQLAIQELANRTEAVTEVSCRTKFGANLNPPEPDAIHIYRIVQESITNAIKHGKPRKIVIESKERAGMLELTITDDGNGFEPEAGSTGLGLNIFQYRARLIGAEIKVKRAGPKGGCRVTCLLPVEKT